MAQKMYADAQAAEQTESAEQTSSADNDDAVDAEFEEVKEDDK